ncbi:DUF2231 domain-containing protein, partial [Modestobacter marinus]|uniref:DUF2231 domain-containing protein n=1 Tax=Modestobacter marinus TaxID=477641 RepID=UPI00201AD194
MSVRSRLERVLGAVERWEVLDAPGYQVEHGIALTYLLTGRYARPLQDLLHGVWLGHPPHEALVTVPVGAWTAASVLDGLDATGRGGPGAGPAARTVVGVGVAGAVASAATGFTDWQHAHDGARRVGLVHAGVNSTALALYVWSFADRGRGRAVRARVTAAAGLTLTVASSWLGGALSYRHGLGTDPADRTLPPRRLTPALPDADPVDGAPAGVDVAGRPLLLAAPARGVHA